jgi:two-component system cell cycle sensor histidine kinase/response regulator CckA
MKTILVLEDEPAVLSFLRRMLRDYNLKEATTAEQALQLFIASGRKLDLLLADVTLPVSSGIEVAMLLRSESPILPVILTSGYPVECWSDRKLADLGRLGSHLVTILEKPFSAHVLSGAISALIGTPLPEQARTA